MKKYHEVEKVAFVETKMTLTVDGKEYTFLLADISKKLSDASTVERARCEISPAGYGIHWPLVDEDLSIDSLIGVRHNRGQTKESVSA